MRFFPSIFTLTLILPLLGQEKITYDDQIFPIFQQTCLNCHNPDKNKGGLDLSSYTGAMKGGSGGKIATSGDTSSKLLTCLSADGELKMPPEGDRLASDKINLIKRWIEGGLLENKNSTAKKAEKPRFQFSASSPEQKPEGPPAMPADLLLEPIISAPCSSAIHAIAAAPWAPLIAITSHRQVLLVHSETLELMGILPFPEGEPTSLAFTPDSRYLIVGGGIAAKSGTTVTFDVVTGQRILQVAKEFDTVLAADLRPGFDRVATGSSSKLVKIWDAKTGELEKSIKKHTDWITALDISPDGVLLATGDRNGGVYAWEAETGGEFHTLRAHQAGITQLVFRNDSNLLASASEDGSVRIWEMNGGTEVKKIDAHGGGVCALAWARNGIIATSGRDKKTKFWKPDFNLLREGSAIAALPTALCLNAEATRAFVGDDKGVLTVIDVATGKIISSLQNNPPTIAARLIALDLSIKQHAEGSDSLEKAASADAEKLAQHKDHVRKIEQQFFALQKQHHTESQRLSVEQSQRQQALKKIQAMQADEAKQNSILANAHTELEHARAAHQQAQQAGQALDIVLENVKTSEGKVQAATTKIAEIQAQIAQHTKQQQEREAQIEKSSQALAATSKNREDTEKALKEAKAQLPAMEKAARETKAKFDSAPRELAALHRQKQHWHAASINTQFLQATKERDSLTEKFQEQAATFSALANDLTKFYQSLRAEADPEKKAALNKECRTTEQKLLHLRKEIDEQTANRSRIAQKAANLLQSYQTEKAKIPATKDEG